MPASSSTVPASASRRPPLEYLFLLGAALLPAADRFVPETLRVSDLMRPVFIFAIVGLGLNVVTGFTGLLHLGSAAFMAIGVYAYAILSSDLYPFQIGFWPALAVTAFAGMAGGVALGAPTLRCRGDYLAIVTLGFGEIVQDILKNLEGITKGTQGINPLPVPSLPGGVLLTPEQPRLWYYFLLVMLALCVALVRNLERSRMGRSWIAIREDELAAACMRVQPVRTKLLAFATGAGLCAFAGGLWAAMLGTTGEPGTYDFSVSISALCIVIVGGMGSVPGVLVGALVMIGLDQIVLAKLTAFLSTKEWGGTGNVYYTPSSWKFFLYGFALIVVMRFRPEGAFPSRSVRLEMNAIGDDEPPADRRAPSDSEVPPS